MSKLYLKRSIKGFCILLIVFAVFVVAGLGKYEGLSADAQSASALMDSLPNAIKVVYGIGNLDITTLGGYYAILAVYFTIIISVYSASLGSKIIYEEEKLKTSEFIFTKPISRTRLYWNKFFTYYGLVVLINVLSSTIVYLYLLQFDDVVNHFIDMCLVTLIISTLMFAIGAFVSTMKLNKSASLIAIGILIVCYVLRTVGQLLEIDLGFITPFSAFEIEDVYNEGISIMYSIYYIIITIVLSVSAPMFLNKRDIK